MPNTGFNAEGEPKVPGKENMSKNYQPLKWNARLPTTPFFGLMGDSQAT